MDNEPEKSPSRTGWVDLDQVGLVNQPPAEPSAEFARMQDTIEQSQQVFANSEARREVRVEAQLTAVLDRLVAEGGLGGLMISSDDGLLVAQNAAMANGEILAAISSLFDLTVSRAQRENIIGCVEEMTLRGQAGELVVVRRFPDLPRFLLIAYAPRRCTYRRLTAQALKLCSPLLAGVTGKAPAG